jgi:hypothetical protein
MSGDRSQHRGNRVSPDRGNRHMKEALPFGRAFVSGGPSFREGLRFVRAYISGALRFARAHVSRGPTFREGPRFARAHVSRGPTFREGLRFGTAMWWVGQRLATSIGRPTCGEDRVSRGGEIAICPQSRGGSQAARSVRLAACFSARLARRQPRTVAMAVFRPRRRPVAGSVTPNPGSSSVNIRSLRVSGASSAE